MPWQVSHRAYPAANAVAKRHYTCQTPDSAQFVPPGRCVVLMTSAVDAVWTTSWPLPEYVKHAWPGAWVCSLFRREPCCPYLASDLITAAVTATRWLWPAVPARGIVTFVDAKKVRSSNPGYCYLKAGWRYVRDADGHRARTKGGLLVLQQLPDEMPAACPPDGAQLRLEVPA